MPIDYEVEYDNRARVPEHPEIFARWLREGAAYRAAAHNTKLGLAYGPSLRRTIDLFPARDDDKAPLAMFIHGGWWRSLEPSMFSQVAAGPNARGITVAVTGYDLCPHVSIADIIEQIRAACLYLWRKRRQRIFIYGHSAGGHLAACMVATDWKASPPTRRPISCPPPMQSPACSISCRWCTCRRIRICGSTTRKRAACRRCIGAFRPAEVSMQWLARWNRASFCARAKQSPKRGDKAWRSRVTRKLPGPIISPSSIR